MPLVDDLRVYSPSYNPDRFSVMAPGIYHMPQEHHDPFALTNYQFVRDGISLDRYGASVFIQGLYHKPFGICYDIRSIHKWIVGTSLSEPGPVVVGVRWFNGVTRGLRPTWIVDKAAEITARDNRPLWLVKVLHVTPLQPMMEHHDPRWFIEPDTFDYDPILGPLDPRWHQHASR